MNTIYSVLLVVVILITALMSDYLVSEDVYFLYDFRIPFLDWKPPRIVVLNVFGIATASIVTISYKFVVLGFKLCRCKLDFFSIIRPTSHLVFFVIVDWFMVGRARAHNFYHTGAPKKVLIIHASVGGGHKSAGKPLNKMKIDSTT